MTLLTLLTGSATDNTTRITVQYHDGSAWRDISADVCDGTLRWSGGIRGAGPTDRVAVPGGFSVELNNSAANSGATLGYYSPNHASKRAGWAIGAKIRVQFSSAGNVRLWSYRITDIKPVAGQYRSRRVEVTAKDYIEEFSKRKVSGLNIQTDKLGNELLAELVESLPVAPAATDYDTGVFSMPYAFHEERDEDTYCLTVLQKISQSDLSYIYVDGDATQGETLHYENHVQRMSSLASSATLSDTMTDLTINHSADNIWNKVRSTTYPVEIGISLVVLGSIPEEFVLEPGQTRTVFLRYTDENSTRRVSGTGIVAPVVDDDYRMSSVYGNSGNDLNDDLTVTSTPYANSMMVTLTNNAAVRGFVNLLQVRGYAVSTFDKVDSNSEDATSIETYGERTITYSMPYCNNSPLGQAFADELVRRHKDPGTQISGVTFIANSSSTLMGYALTLGIGTRVTVAETVTGVNADFFINGFEYELLTKNRLQVTWNLEKNYNTTAYWILEDATYGVLDSTTILAPL